jgi:Ca2+-binding EF-hand superfamily protein
VHTGTSGRFFLERLFAAFDKDRSGSIDKDEFFQGLNVFMRGAPEEKQLRKFFKKVEMGAARLIY